ncbi:MAG TPA: type II toxin-antitoxin system VapB family antitoxin [Polyangiales bacterium]|jgi:antitoxin VapB
MRGTKAKVFWSGRSQAVRLPKQYRFAGESVVIRRQGNALIIEPVDAWPEDYVESFRGIGDDFVRPPQGTLERRERLR